MDKCVAMVLMHSIAPVKFLTFSNCMSADALNLYTHDTLGNDLTIPQQYFTRELGVQRIAGWRGTCLVEEQLAAFPVTVDDNEMHAL